MAMNNTDPTQQAEALSGQANPLGMLGLTPQMFQYGQQQADAANAMQVANLPAFGGIAIPGAIAGSGIKHALEDVSGYVNPAIQMSQKLNNLWNASGQLLSSSAEGQQAAANGTPLTVTQDGLVHRSELFQLLCEKNGLPPSVYMPVLKQFADVGKSLNDYQASKRKAYGIADVSPDKMTGINAFIASQNKGVNGGLGDFDGTLKDIPQSQLINEQNQLEALQNGTQTPAVQAQIKQLQDHIKILNTPPLDNDMITRIIPYVSERKRLGLPVDPKLQAAIDAYTAVKAPPVPIAAGGTTAQRSVPGASQGSVPVAGTPTTPYPTRPFKSNGTTIDPGVSGIQGLNTAVQDYGTKLAPITRMDAIVKDIQDILKRNPNGIPGYGRITSVLPDQAVSMLPNGSDALKFRQSLQALTSPELHKLIGGAQSLSELQNNLTQFGTKKGLPDEAVVNFLNNFVDRYKAERNSTLLAAHPDVVKEATKRGMFGSSDVPLGNDSYTIATPRIGNNLDSAINKVIASNKGWTRTHALQFLLQKGYIK